MAQPGRKAGDPVNRNLQVLKRIGEGESEMALSVGTKGSAPGSGYAGLPEELGAEGVAVQSKGFYIGKGIKSAARCGTGDARRAALWVKEAVQELELTMSNSIPLASSGCIIP